MDLVDRARLLLAKAEPSVSGSHGHSALLSAASALVWGFDLDEGTALGLLRESFNPRCNPPWNERDLLRKVQEANKLGNAKHQRGYLIGSSNAGSGRPKETHSRGYSAPAAAQEVERIKKRQAYDAAALRAMQHRGFRPGHVWLAERSPVDPRRVTPMAFLDAILERGEKTLVFYNFYSQGEYGHVAGKPGQMYQVAGRPGPRPKKVEGIPLTGRVGAWYLPNPTNGRWYPTGQVDEAGNPILSRRSGGGVTAFRYMLLESDDAPEEEWLGMLCQLPLPITALYTSGGRSVHALVRVDCDSKSQFDAFKDRVTPLLSRFGADPGAITAVRLTRIPGVLREGTEKKRGEYVRFETPQLQQLLYLNPAPETMAMKMMPRLREIGGNPS
jgi:hypothetical protein